MRWTDTRGTSVEAVPRYPDSANRDLLDRLPLAAHTVLDVGCGTGALGLAYRHRNPRARLFGIEKDLAAYEVARRRLDHVYDADLDIDATPFVGDVSPHGFDCIVYGDVLEHLRDPWATLRAHVKYLSHGGIILICVPNLEHWSFVDRLLRGNWHYEHQGLLDQTHLRWFTTRTMREALEGAGLLPVDVTPRPSASEPVRNFVQSITPALTALGVDASAYSERAGPVQYIWRAQHKQQSPLLVASTRLPPVGGVSEIRVTEPMQALLSEPGFIPLVTDLAHLPSCRPALPGILILHRPLLAGASGLQTILALIQQGWLIVCEFDDHPGYIPVMQRPDIQNFKAVHAVQTSTEPLAAVLRRENAEVAVFPNAVVTLPQVEGRKGSGSQTLFFGALNRGGDWPTLIPGLNRAAARAGSRLRFRVIADRQFFDALETPHKQFHPLCDYPTYLELLAGSDIALLPLADTPFNRCKSDLKFLEAAARGVAVVASTVVYAASVANGWTGLLFTTAEECERQVCALVANPNLAQAIGTAARSYVAGNRMLAYQVRHRADWYRSLWSRRDELQQALFARVPELRRGMISA